MQQLLLLTRSPNDHRAAFPFTQKAGLSASGSEPHVIMPVGCAEELQQRRCSGSPPVPRSGWRPDTHLLGAVTIRTTERIVHLDLTWWFSTSRLVFLPSPPRAVVDIGEQAKPICAVEGEPRAWAIAAHEISASRLLFRKLTVIHWKLYTPSDPRGCQQTPL